MANGARTPPVFPSSSGTASSSAAPPLANAQTAAAVGATRAGQQHQLQQAVGMSHNGNAHAQAKQRLTHDLVRMQQQPVSASVRSHGAAGGGVGGANGAGSQLQQRAAAAAQFLTAERKISSREIQAMLEKNEAALRGWNALHTQERTITDHCLMPPKTLAKEHKEWIRKCMTFRQQIGARLEVLASLADKQIAIEDESTDRVQQQEKKIPPAPSSQPAAAKKPKASQTRQVAQPPKATPPPRATAAAAIENNNNNNNVQLVPTPPAPIPSPTSFPDPPMPMTTPVNPQQFDYSGAGGNGAFYDSGQSAAMTSAGFTGASVSANAAVAPSQSFPMSDAQTFATNSYMNTATNPAAAAAFMNQQQHYMMNPAAMNMAMMNPQYLAMQMQMQNQLPMNMATTATMYNPTMFNNYMGMGTNQLPADPFNTSFNQPVFPTQAQFNPVAGGFDGMAGMQPAQMMNQMNAFPMMSDQMMMNAFPYGGMSIPQQQQLQQQQLQPQQFQNPPTPAQAFPPQLQDSQANAFTESSLFDDAAASNLFDGFPEDAFLQM